MKAGSEAYYFPVLQITVFLPCFYIIIYFVDNYILYVIIQINMLLKVICMINDFRKFFGNNISIHELVEKPNIALFLSKRTMNQIKIDGIPFVLIEIRPDEKFGAVALKKQMGVYEDKLQSNIAFSFHSITKTQRNSLIYHRIPFVALPEQIYLPFLGVVLSNHFRRPKEIKKEKMMPVTQQLFLYLLYHQNVSILKSSAAEALGLTRTSITRASDQLLEMNLIQQEKSGKEIHMKLSHDPQESINLAKPYMINPVQSKLTINKSDLHKELLYAGETALSEYSMLNPPQIPEVAVYKATIDKNALLEVDAKWSDPASIITVELWKYDPLLFSSSNKVDPVSLACSLKDIEDERVEMAIDDMMEELSW